MQRPWVWLALLATLAACWWVDRQEAADMHMTTARMRPRSRPVADKTAPVPVTTIQVLASTAGVAANDRLPVITDLFAVWQPAPAVTVTASPAAVHPFTVNGRLLHDGQWQLFLTDGQQQYVVQAQSHFADGWHVVELDGQHVRLQHGNRQFEIRLDDGE